jgi:excisionase family DNA binding protein
MQTRDERRLPPGLLTVNQVAEVLAVSIRQVWRLNATGRLPAPVRLGRSVRWRSAELEDWISAGCPANDGRKEVQL